MSLIQFRTIVTKTYFPREIIPLSQVCSRLLDFAAASSLFVVLLIVYRVAPTRWLLLAPALFVLLFMFTTGVALLCSSVNVFYRDVSPVVQIALQLWLYVTPIAYPMSRVPARWYRWIAANPLSGIVEGMRSAIVYGREPDWSLLAVSASLCVTTFVVAFVLFKRLDKYFADVI
jgi:lipopolysaccharide transport system permease protein